MRLGRTAWLVLGIGAFVIAFATLAMIYARQHGEGKELEQNLAGTQTQLTKLILGRESLEGELAQQQSELGEAHASLSSAVASFPRLEASIEYNEVLSELADRYSLEIMSMAAENPREKEVEDIIFVTISFEVKVRGEVNSVLSLVDAIAKDERFASATVEVVDIRVPEPQPVWEERELPTATIKFVGYSYGGE